MIGESHTARVAVNAEDTAWTAGAYALAAALICGVAACMWGVPLSLSDNVVRLLEAQRTSLWDGVVAALHVKGLMRPLHWAEAKILLEVSNGHYYLTFQGFHAGMFAALVLAVLAVLRVRTALDFAAASVALVVLLGLHTIGNTVREQPITVVTCCAVAMLLAFAETSSPWRDVLAVVTLIIAIFYVEIGLLVWVIYAGAYAVGRQGVSPAAVAVATVLVLGYFVLRFYVLPVGAPAAFPRGTGFGFTSLESDELARRFGDRPLVLYAYNVAASIASVLFSEPRGGIFHVTRRFVQGEVRPWMWVNLITSALTTACIAAFLWRRHAEWRRWTFSRDHALILVACGVIVANAVISYPYSRDVTMSPAGVCYAIAVFPVVRWMLGGIGAGWRGAAVVALTLVLSTGWAWRTIALTYSVREIAFSGRNDWATAEEWLQRLDVMPTDPQGVALVSALKREALTLSVPNPRIAQPWAEHYLDPGH